jgi:hypothetical protein
MTSRRIGIGAITSLRRAASHHAERAHDTNIAPERRMTSTDRYGPSPVRQADALALGIGALILFLLVRGG